METVYSPRARLGEAAEMLGVSRRIVQSARKVLDCGNNELISVVDVGTGGERG